LRSGTGVKRPRRVKMGRVQGGEGRRVGVGRPEKRRPQRKKRKVTKRVGNEQVRAKHKSEEDRYRERRRFVTFEGWGTASSNPQAKHE